MISFVNPLFLGALALAAAPIAIHFLTRDRLRRVAFSTLRFFAGASRGLLRRRRLRETILLAMRVAACALLALAFARPYLGEPARGAASEFSRAVVLAIDVSASMRTPGVWEAAREEAEAVLGSLRDGADAAALVSFDGSAEVVAPLTGELARVRTALAGLSPGWGGTDTPGAILRANEILASARAERKELVLVSDMQGPLAAWSAPLDEIRLAPGVVFSPRAVRPRREGGAVAIVDADCPASTVKDRIPRAISVRVANRSAEDLKGVPVTLRLGDAAPETQEVRLGGGGSAAARFRHVFERDGDNPGSVEVGPADEPGGVFHFVVRVVPRMKIVILNGSASPRATEDAAFFVKAALEPSEDSPFVVETVEASRATERDLEGASVAILADVGEAPKGLREALGRLLERGGGLLFLPADAVEPATFRRAFAGLAPCALRQVLSVAGGPSTAPSDSPRTARARTLERRWAVMAKIAADHPVFEPFLQPHHGELGIARFERYWEVTDSQLSRVLARFDDGRPALLEREIGPGLSMLLASPPRTGWNDLAHHAVFPPLLHQLVRHLAVRTERRTAYLVGDSVDLPPGSEVVGPDGSRYAVAEGARFAPRVPGVYIVRPVEGQEFRFAANTPFEESDPAAVDPQEMADALASSGQGLARGELFDDEGREEPDRLGAWWYVTLAMTVLLAAELFVASRTRRH